MPLDHSAQVTAVVLFIVFGSGIVISIAIVGMQLRAKLRAIEVLKVYAERGEEPPANVVEAVNQIGRPPPPPPPPAPEQRRAWHLSHAAGSVALSAGCFGVVTWRMIMAPRDPDWLLIVALVIGIFFAGAAAARLTAAHFSNDGRG